MHKLETNWKEIFTIHITIEDLSSRIYKELEKKEEDGEKRGGRKREWKWEKEGKGEEKGEEEEERERRRRSKK